MFEIQVYFKLQLYMKQTLSATIEVVSSYKRCQFMEKINANGLVDKGIFSSTKRTRLISHRY